MRTIRHLVPALLLAASVAPPAGAASWRGEWSDALARTTGSVRFVGRLQPGAATIAGRLRCGRCPVRGRVRLDCTPDGGVSSRCTGTTARGCSVEGYFYATRFEGQYACGGRVGALGFGRR